MVRLSALIDWRKPAVLQYYFYLLGESKIPLTGRDDDAFGIFSIEEGDLDMRFLMAGYSSAVFL